MKEALRFAAWTLVLGMCVAVWVLSATTTTTTHDPNTSLSPLFYAEKNTRFLRQGSPARVLAVDEAAQSPGVLVDRLRHVWPETRVFRYRGVGESWLEGLRVAALLPGWTMLVSTPFRWTVSLSHVSSAWRYGVWGHAELPDAVLPCAQDFIHCAPAKRWSSAWQRVWQAQPWPRSPVLLTHGAYASRLYRELRPWAHQPRQLVARWSRLHKEGFWIAPVQPWCIAPQSLHKT